MESRCIAHVDMDAFYVNVELQRRPELRGKPVVVAGSGPRAVVTTASYEARKFGVFSATPASRARRLCPDAVFVPPDFELYRARSKDVMAVLRDHVDRVEQVGLDEAYLDLTGLDSPRAAARRVKAAIFDRTGLGCSIGVGPSKLVAKVASDAEKPDGFVVLTREEACVRFDGLSPGLSPESARRASSGCARSGSARWGSCAWPATSASPTAFGPRQGRWLHRFRPLRGRARPSRPCAWRSRSRARPPSTMTSRGVAALEPVLAKLTRRPAASGLVGQEPLGPYGWDQDPARRLLHAYAGADTRRAHQ